MGKIPPSERSKRYHLDQFRGSGMGDCRCLIQVVVDDFWATMFIERDLKHAVCVIQDMRAYTPTAKLRLVIHVETKERMS